MDSKQFDARKDEEEVVTKKNSRGKKKKMKTSNEEIDEPSIESAKEMIEEIRSS